MNPLHELLNKYRRYVAPDSAARKALVMSIKEASGIDINERTIRIIGTVAYIDTDPLIKSAIFMRQEVILKKTGEALGKMVLTAIR
jgi:hypothetical protein